MGRIRRVGTDTVVNYSFQETSAYDANDPAGTVGAWPDDAAMDQELRQASPTEVTAEGVLITFERFPDTFTGAKVKVQPTYDFDAGEDPYLEQWIHNSETGEWTKRSSIQFANVFVGAATGVRKVFDLTFFPFERNIDQVWITMNPGSTGTPSMDFAAVQLFGQCEATLPRGGNGTGDPCFDPNDPFYTGTDDEGNPCPGTSFGPPPTNDIPELDLCSAESIAQYREAISDIPGFVEQFDAWLDSNQEGISLYCTGTNSDPPAGQPNPPHPNPLPPLDLCNGDSIDAFRAALGTTEAVASFDSFIDGLEADGFFEFACPPPLPPEEYIDPNSLEAAPEPDPTVRPFGQGPGGVPDLPNGNSPRRSLPPQHPANGGGDDGPFSRSAWLIASDTGFPGYSGASGCDIESAAESVAVQMAGCTPLSSSIQCEAVRNGVVDTPFALTTTTVLCFNLETSTDWNITAASVLFTRLRATFDSAIVNANVTIEIESGALCFFDAGKYAASQADSKILFSDGGLGPPDFSTVNEAQWQGVSSLGPIDFTVMNSQLNQNPANFGTLAQNPMVEMVAKITVETTDEPTANLVIVVQ